MQYRKVFCGVFFGMLVALVGQVRAQEPSEADMQKWKEFMTPGENHKVLQAKEGTWKVKVKIWMDPNAPPSESEATCESKMIMDGRYLTETVKGTFQGAPFEGRATTAYDNGLNKFVGNWIDNMGTGIMTSEGTWDATKKQFTFAMAYTDPMTGKPGKGRSIDRMIDKDNWVTESFKLMPDGKEFKDMELTYTRHK